MMRSDMPRCWFKGLLIGLWFCATGLFAATNDGLTIHRSKNLAPTAAYKWVDILLEASGREVDRVGARPTILSRSMAVVLTAMYDAWAAYDDKAIGTRLGDQLRRPKDERTLKNKEIAIAYAAYRTLLDIYGDADEKWIRGQMKAMGYNPDERTEDKTRAEGVGNVAAAAVIEYRHHDGANQLGDEPGSAGEPYSDYTFYRPLNTPDLFLNKLTWLPIPFVRANGETFSPGFLTAHWYRVKPFALESSKQFRAPPPPQWDSAKIKKEIEEAVAVNSALTIEQKAIVEFMRDGPRSTGQSGHWLLFAQDVSRRDKYNLDQDVKLFFAIGNISFDGFIACWETKRFYDTGRPYWFVRLQKKDQVVRGWAGPGNGVKSIKAEEWLPYSPAVFRTPPFPGYTSGHATVSGAAAKILELYTGSDRFNAVEVRSAGDLTEKEFTVQQMQAVDGSPDGKATTKEVRLPLPTFTATSEMAAVSRLWGGYHIRTDNEAGLDMGRKIAVYSWPIYQAYFNGEKKISLR
ncbi:MAG: vanadium-dependent haloperoxidase [Oligoflexales bacterium]